MEIEELNKVLRCAECGEIIGRDEDYIAVAEIDPLDYNLITYSYYHIECLPPEEQEKFKEAWESLK